MQMPIVKFAEFIRHRKEFIRIDDFETYKRARVQLHWRGIVIRDQLEGAAIKTKEQQIARTGELLVAEIDAKVGGVGIVPPELDGAIVSSHYFLFEIDEEKCRLSWLDYYIRSRGLEDQIAARGSTNYAAIRPHHVLDFEMPLPPLDDQRRIVARIAELSAKIEEAHAIRRLALDEAKALGSSALSTPFDFVSGDDLPTGWHWKALPDVLENHEAGMMTGPFGTLLQKSDTHASGVPVLGISNVQANLLIPGFTDYVTHEKAESLSPYRLQRDDIVIARSGTVGRACLVPGHLDPMPIMSTNLMRLRVDRRLFLPRLLCSLFNGSRLIERHKNAECRGSTRAFFTQKILSRLHLPTPPLAEQNRIVAYLDDLQSKVDSLKRLQEETAKELNALLPSILSRAFSSAL